MAVYKAKADGRNRVVRYTIEQLPDELAERRRDLHESPLGKSLAELEQQPPAAAAH